MTYLIFVFGYPPSQARKRNKACKLIISQTLLIDNTIFLQIFLVSNMILIETTVHLGTGQSVSAGKNCGLTQPPRLRTRVPTKQCPHDDEVACRMRWNLLIG